MNLFRIGATALALLAVAGAGSFGLRTWRELERRDPNLLPRENPVRFEDPDTPSPATQADAMTQPDTLDLNPLTQSRFQMLRSTTVLPEQPLTGMLERLLPAGGSVGWLVSPQGKMLGFTVSGSGQAFGEALAAEIKRLVTPEASKLFLTLAHFNGWKDLRYETVLGQTGWIRAGVRGLDATRIQVVLSEERVPVDEIARALTDPVARGAQALGVDVISDGKRDGLAIPVSLSALPEGLDDPTRVTGASRLVIERVVGWPDTTTIRRSGLSGLGLIDWQVAQGIAGDAAKRVGTVHGVLDTDSPSEILWQAGRFSESLVYGYDPDSAKKGVP